MKTALRRILILISVVVFTLCVGTAGFMLIEQYSLFDAFYMSLITITTIGYAEVHELSHTGRIFNSLYIFIGVSTLFLAIGLMTQQIVEWQYEEQFERRRVRKMINKLRNHHIVCGFGRVGRSAAEQLKQSGASLVVLDTDVGRVEKARSMGMLAMQGDATQDQTLQDVGIMQAKGLVAALQSDADNVFLILSAKTLNPAITIAARVANEEAQSKMRLAGADVVLAPYAGTGLRLAQALLRPHVLQFLDFPMNSIGLNVDIEQIEVAPQSELVNRSLADTQIGRIYGVIVLAIQRAGGQMLFNPRAETKVQAGDYLIVMGERDGLERLERTLGQVKA